MYRHVRHYGLRQLHVMLHFNCLNVSRHTCLGKQCSQEINILCDNFGENLGKEEYSDEKLKTFGS